MKNASFSWRLPAALLLLTLCLTSPAAAQTAQFTGLTPLYNPAPGVRDGSSTFHCTADAAGNTFMMVRYRGALRLGGTVVAAPADTLYRQAVAKLNPAGVLQWLRDINTEDSGVDCVSLQTDVAGNLYALGRICCGPAPHTVDGLVVSGLQEGTTAYVAKWSGGGVIQYATAFATTPSNPLATDLNPWRLAVSPTTGALAVTGMYIGAMVVGADTLRQIERSLGPYINANAFVARLSVTGTPQWALRMEDADSVTFSFATELGFDAADNLHFVGFYGAGASPTPRTGINGVALPAHYGIFRIKLSPTAQVVYAEADPLIAESFGFAVAPDGSSYLAYSIPFSGALASGQPVRVRGSEATLVARYAPDGRLQWLHQFDGRDSTDYVQIGQRMLALSRDGQEVFVGGRLHGVLRDDNLQLGTPATTRGGPQHAWLAALSAAGKVLWGHTVDSRAGSYPRQLQALPDGKVGLLAIAAGDSIGLGNLTISTPGNRNNKAFFTTLSRQYNTLSGAAYLDANADGVQNATETGFPGGLVVEVNPGAVPCAAPESTGHYDAYLDLGVNFTATLPAPPPHYTVVGQGGAPATFSTYGGVAAGRSFALQPIAGQQDVQVLLTLISPARPGALVTYQVQYRNTGTAALPTGTVALAPDARLLYQTSSQAPTTTGATGLTWAYANLLPGQTRRLTVTFRLPPTTPLGGLLTSTATVAPLIGDLLPLDNTSTASRTVTGSFDPNDIEVNHTQLSPGQVVAGEWLEYTVRFQNHGSDTAFVVALHDSLPAHLLRLGTLQLLAASHNCNWSLSPAGRLLVRFDDIQLPSQTTNPIASDGFVRFRVRPVGTLVPGDRIPNRAAIFFDYNAPLATNTALTTIQTTLGLPGENDAADAVRVWPNPASGLLHVEAPGAETGPLTLTLTDALGRAVRTTTRTTATTLDVSGLPAGLYVLRGVGAGTPFSQRVVVR